MNGDTINTQKELKIMNGGIIKTQKESNFDFLSHLNTSN